MAITGLEWLLALAAITLAGVAVIALRRRRPQRADADTFQDMSIFDDEVASGNYEIDPIAEAEVYLAYGNRQQAISLLNKAALDHPERQDIQAKILEMGDAVDLPRGRR